MVTKCVLDDFLVRTAVKGGRGSLVVIYIWEGDVSWMAADWSYPKPGVSSHLAGGTHREKKQCLGEQPSGRRDTS